MATTTLTSPEAGKSDTLSITISPKSTAKLASESLLNQKAGLSATESLWYRVHDALYKAGLVVAD